MKEEGRLRIKKQASLCTCRGRRREEQQHRNESNPLTTVLHRVSATYIQADDGVSPRPRYKSVQMFGPVLVNDKSDCFSRRC